MCALPSRAHVRGAGGGAHTHIYMRAPRFRICGTLEPDANPLGNISRPLHARGLQTRKKTYSFTRSIYTATRIIAAPWERDGAAPSRPLFSRWPARRATYSCSVASTSVAAPAHARAHTLLGAVCGEGCCVGSRWRSDGCGAARGLFLLTTHLLLGSSLSHNASLRHHAASLLGVAVHRVGGRGFGGAARRTRSPCSQSSYSSCAIIRIFFSTIKPCFGSW